MSSKTFMTIFMALHVALAGGAYLMWANYGLWVALFTVIAGVIALQTWLRERRMARRYRQAGRRR